MGEKTPKGKKRGPVNRPEFTTESVTLESQHCDATESTSFLDSPLAESLLRSHVELCTALRLAGRQILRLHGDQESLDKIRQALKKAEGLRKFWRNPEWAETAIPDSPAEASAEPVFASDGQTQSPTRKRPGRLSRPHPHRVLRFPSGESSR